MGVKLTVKKLRTIIRESLTESGYGRPMEHTPASFINLQAYQARGDRVLLVTPEGERDIPVPELAQDDPDEFEAWIFGLAGDYHIDHILDVDGQMVTLQEWTQSSV